MNAFLLLVGLSVQADTARLTLADAVTRALASYPSVAAARALRNRASADVGEARAAWFPRVSVEASINRFELPMVVAPLHGFDPRNPPLFNHTLIQSGASLSYSLLDFGTRAGRVRAQREMERAADAGLDNAEAQLAARVVNAYLRVLTARDLLAAQDQRLRALTAEADRVSRLLTEGKVARVEALRVDAEARRARADRIAGAAQLDVAEHELAQLAGAQWETVRAARLEPVALADTALASDTTTATRAALVARARQNAPDALEQRSRVAAARAGLAAVKGTRLPELRLSSAIIDRGRAWDDFSAEWQVGVSVAYPLYTGGARTSAIRRADADARVAEQQLRAAELGVEHGVDRTLAALREAHARVAALESAERTSAEVVRIERLALDVGSGTRSDYLEAEANLLRSRAGLIEAHHAEVSARVELARILGELSPEWLARSLESK